MPSPNTRHLLAGHGPRHVRTPLLTAQVAQRIVDSIRLHTTRGIIRQAEDYTMRTETLAAIQVLLKGETICD